MKTKTPFKTFALLGLASLTLAAGASQADSGYIYFGNNPYNNPWLNGPAYQQAREYANMKERIAQLDQRQDNQLKRILSGMEEGDLTLREAAALLREHLSISALERDYKADGHLGPNELRDLEQRLDEANRHIAFEKHDREQQHGPMGRADDRGNVKRW